MNNEEQRMSPEDRDEKDACRWKHFDRIHYGKDNDDEYCKKIDDKLTEEEFEKAIEIGKKTVLMRADSATGKINTDGRELEDWGFGKCVKKDGFDNENNRQGVERHRAMEKRLREAQ